MQSPFTPSIHALPAEQQAANAVVAAGNSLFTQMAAIYQRSYNLVWANPATTPDKVVAAMGTQAQKVFALSAALAAFLVTAGATAIPTTMPAGWNFVANADGSVTLTPAS